MKKRRTEETSERGAAPKVRRTRRRDELTEAARSVSQLSLKIEKLQTRITKLEQTLRDHRSHMDAARQVLAGALGAPVGIVGE